MSDIDVYKEWLGIPEGDRPPDHYTLLRLVQFEDDLEKIQGNYRKLNAHVRKYATGQYLKQSQDLLNEMAKAMLCLTDPDAKREYDASEGRESGGGIDDQPDTVLRFLVAKEQIKQGQVEEIQRFAEARGLSHRDAVVQMKLVKAGLATQAYAAELRMPFIDLNDMLPEDEILDMLPKQVVKRHTCLPLFEDRGKVLVACADEPSPDLEDEVRMRYGMPMRAALAVPRSIQQAIARYYAPGERSEPKAASASGKSGKPTKTKTAKAKPVADPMSPEEQGKRQQISLIIICWSLIGTIMGLNFSGMMAGNTFGMVGSGLLVAGVVAGVLKLTYWK